MAVGAFAARPRQQIISRGPAAFIVEGRLGDQRRGLNLSVVVGLAHRIKVTLEAIIGRHGMSGARNEADAAMAELQEMLDAEPHPRCGDRRRCRNIPA